MGVVANQSGDFARAFGLLDQGLAVFRKEYGEKSYEAGVAFYYRGVTSEALGRFEDARRDYESSLAIVEALGGPAESQRLSTLHDLARLNCRHGAIEKGRAQIEKTLSVLDSNDAYQKKWIERFEQAREECRSAK
jgi:tetratricopeptide (TPR) repeat protein